MLKKSLWGIALCAAASLTLLLTPATSDAQRRGGGGRGGSWSGGRGWGRGDWDRGRGWGWGWGGFGTGLALGYGLGNWGRGDGYYGGYSYPYYSGYYSTPYYSYDYSYPAYAYSTPMYDQSNYGAANFQQQQTNPNAVDLTVYVPDPNAQIWFENHQTQQRGTVRQFESTATPGRTYNFHIKARMMQNGKPVEVTRDVQAQAGQHVTVNFGNAQGGQGFQGADNLQQMPAGNVPFYGNEQNYYGNNQFNVPPQGSRDNRQFENQPGTFNNQPGTITNQQRGNLNNQANRPGTTTNQTPSNQGTTNPNGSTITQPGR